MFCAVCLHQQGLLTNGSHTKISSPNSPQSKCLIATRTEVPRQAEVLVAAFTQSKSLSQLSTVKLRHRVVKVLIATFHRRSASSHGWSPRRAVEVLVASFHRRSASSRRGLRWVEVLVAAFSQSKSLSQLSTIKVCRRAGEVLVASFHRRGASLLGRNPRHCFHAVKVPHHAVEVLIACGRSVSSGKYSMSAVRTSEFNLHFKLNI